MIITFLLFLATFRSSVALAGVFFFLVLTFMLLAISEFTGNSMSIHLGDDLRTDEMNSVCSQGRRHPGMHHCDDCVLHGIGWVVQPRCELLCASRGGSAQASRGLGIAPDLIWDWDWDFVLLVLWSFILFCRVLYERVAQLRVISKKRPSLD